MPGATRRKACAVLRWNESVNRTWWTKQRLEVSPSVLSAHFDQSYGIFSGPAEYVAELRFTPEMARWISEEIWHPDQQGAFEADGSWLLKVPFSHSRELIMDVLRYGADAEVLAPDFLREAVAVKRSRKDLRNLARQ